MTPTERSALQKAILDAARSAPSGRASQTALGNKMGCDRSEVSRFETGTRRMDLDEVVALCDDDELAGAAAILAPLAERFGLMLVAKPTAEKGGRDLLRQAASLSGAVGTLAADLGDATAPESEGGTALSPGERAELLTEIRAAMVRLAQLEADVQAKPRAVA
jgi:hypothetical protein